MRLFTFVCDDLPLRLYHVMFDELLKNPELEF